jgi:hypothetical protein
MAADDMDRDEAISFLERDGDLRVPCSRYGRSTSDCAPVAWRLAEIIREANGDPITEEAVDYCMGLVVNDHDDVASLLAAHGNADELAEWADYAEDGA